MNKLYIGNLPYRLEQHELEQLFAPCGEVTEVHLVKDRSKRRLKGFGFVSFADANAAKAALALDGSEFYGRTLKISIAKDQSERTEMEDDEMEEPTTLLGCKHWVKVVLLSIAVSALTSYVVTTNVWRLPGHAAHALQHNPASDVVAAPTPSVE